MDDEKKRTFDDDDLFERKPYAEFLKKLILNCDNYHRDDDVKAYAIALDSPWGSGKSVFLEKFESMLEQDCKDQLRVVHYNAWENDFWDNAFEPFVNAVFSHPLFASPLADQTETSAGKKLGDALKHLVVSFAKKRLDAYFDPSEMMKALESAAGAVGTATSQNTTIISPAYSIYKSNLQAMKDAMKSVLEEATPKESAQNVKLVIIIDELDRCRPTFAIETLEIAKHIMDVSNVVYLFALDVKQLGAAVKQVYGTDTDSIGYLMRFFSYYTHLPDAKKQFVIEKIVASLNLEIHDNYTDLGQPMYDEYGHIYTDSIEILKKDMLQVSDALELSVRDLETLSKVYELMQRVFLGEYQNRCAYLLYWFLLCSKYKQPLQFNEWINNKNSGIDFPVSSEQADLLPAILHNQMEMLSNPDFIESVPYCIRNFSDEKFETGDKIAVTYTCDNVTKEKVLCVDYDYGNYNIVIPSPFTKCGDLSGVLFLSDLLYWGKIKGLTLKEFYSQKMEMFNFLPDIQ